MNNTIESPSVETRKSLSGMWIGVGIVLVILSALSAFPTATFPTNQMWEVELLSSLLLTSILLTGFWSRSTVLAIKQVPAPLLVLTGAFITWSLASIFWAGSPFVTLHHTFTWALYLIYLLTFLAILRSETGTRIILFTLAAIAVFLGIFCLIDYAGIVNFTSAEGPIRVRYGKFAELLVTLSPLLWVMCLYVRSRRAWIFMLIGAALSWVTVMLSLSKGAFISGIIGFIILFGGCAFFSARPVRKKILRLAVVWLAVTLATQILFSAALSVPSTTDYITGAADKTRNTASMRVFTWTVAEQMAAGHWLAGVGADNFGIAFNAARADLAARHPSSAREEIAEDYVVERAHNEFLQIFAELGIVGSLLFFAAFAYFVWLAATSLQRSKYKFPPVLWAAFAGLAAFCGSSMVSSFSFRLMQNGLIFFMVFAIALNELAKLRRNKIRIGERERPSAVRSGQRRALMLAASLTILTSVFFGSRAMAAFLSHDALGAEQFEDSEQIFALASRIDPDDAPAYLSFSQKCESEGRHDLAAVTMQEGVNRGFGVTQTYSLLAKYQTLARQDAAAIDTFEEAIRIFPRSVFMRVRYAVFLEQHGRAADAARQMEIAREIDLKHANGWYAIIVTGSLAAFQKSQTDPQTAAPADLRPENAVRQYLDDTHFFHNPS